MLPTRIHERYLFPVFSVLTIMLPLARESRPLFVVLTFTYLSNLAYVLPFLNTGSYIPDGDVFVYVIAAVNLAAFAYALLTMAKKMKVRALSVQEQTPKNPNQLVVEERGILC